MSEKYVKVPVSLIERTAAEYERDGWLLAAEKWRALLSQPTPTAEPIGVEYGVVLDDLGSTDTYVTEAEARAAATSDTPLVRIVTTPLDPESHAAPPSIADMAPGTTFWKGGDTWTIGADGRAHGEDGQSWPQSRIDPSTIRDVTPPEDAA